MPTDRSQPVAAVPRGHLVDSARSPHRLADKYPDLFEAWYLGTQEDSLLFRHEVEARLLAREPLLGIAQKVGVSSAALEHFEAWFFNVLDRLDQPAYVLHQVLGRAVQNGLWERDFDLLWKLYGYHGGPQVLDALIYHFENPTRPDDPNHVGAFFADSFKTRLRLQADLVLRTTRASQNPEMILDGWMRWQEMEKSAGGRGGAQEAILANMQEFLSQLPWVFGDDPDENPIIAQFDRAGVSLRTSEIILIGTHAAPPEITQVLEHYQSANREPSHA